MGGNDEREQTLNQLLTEMDGLTAEVCDPGCHQPSNPWTRPFCVRAGFDRRVPVELPEKGGSHLKVHGQNVKMSDDVDSNAIARSERQEPSGAGWPISLTSALRAVRMGRGSRGAGGPEESVETVIAGYRKNADLRRSADRGIP